MSKKAKIPYVDKVRVMDPEGHIKFKSLKELEKDKSLLKSSDDISDVPQSQKN